MIEIKNRHTGAVIYRSETAEMIAQAVTELIAKTRKMGRRVNLSGINLSGINLSYTDLSYADLSGVNLSHTDLSYVNLSYVNLSGVNLSYANLSYANLYGVSLSYVDLSYADLSGVSLSYADLSYVNLYGSNLVSLGFDTQGCHLLLYHENEQCIIRAGYREFNFPQARKHWAAKPEFLARLDLAEAIARSRGWIIEEVQQCKS